MVTVAGRMTTTGYVLEPLRYHMVAQRNCVRVLLQLHRATRVALLARARGVLDQLAGSFFLF